MTAPAARSRYLYIPPTLGLTRLPSSILGLFTSPLRSKLLPNIIRELFEPTNRPSQLIPGIQPDEPLKLSNFRVIQDESLDSFLSRRFSPEFARTFGSALVHGIYAADSRKLSVRAAFPGVWKAEERGNGSVLWGMLNFPTLEKLTSRIPRPVMKLEGNKLITVKKDAAAAAEAAKAANLKEEEEDWDLGMGQVGSFKDETFGGAAEWAKRIKESSVLSFRDGMETLTKAIVENLESKENVELRREAKVRYLGVKENGQLEVKSTFSLLESKHKLISLFLLIAECRFFGREPATDAYNLRSPALSFDRHSLTLNIHPTSHHQSIQLSPGRQLSLLLVFPSPSTRLRISHSPISRRIPYRASWG